MSIRAKEILYLTSGGALVRENDPAGRTLYCKPGDIISDADVSTYRVYFEAFGWIELAVTKEVSIQIAGVKIRHDDDAGAVRIDLPSRSLIIDVFARCTEAATGSPDIDFGEFGSDTDGLLDGIGQSGICDTEGSEIESPYFKGRGELITTPIEEDDHRIPVKKYYPAGVSFTNDCNSAGTAGEWLVYIMYVVLPEVMV